MSGDLHESGFGPLRLGNLPVHKSKSDDSNQFPMERNEKCFFTYHDEPAKTAKRRVIDECFRSWEIFFDFSAVLHKSSNMLTSLPWYRINEPRFFLLLFWSTIIQQIIRHFVWSARPDTRFLSGFGASSPYKSISAFWYAQRSTFGLCYEIPIRLGRIYRQLIVIKKSLTFWKYQEEKRLERRFWVISKPNPRDVNIRLERRI